MKRHAIFVDAGYVFAQGSVSLLGNTVPRPQLQLDPATMVAQLKPLALAQSPGVQLLRIYWYDGARNGPTVEHLAIANLPDVKLRLGSVNSAGEQKEVDSLLVTDLIDLARNQSICDATVVAADSDLRIAVQIAQTFGVRVHLVGLEPSKVSQSPALRQEVDTVHEISKAGVGQFLAVVNTSPATLSSGSSTSVSQQTPTVTAVKTVSQVIDEAIKRTLTNRSAQHIAQLKAAMAGSLAVPTEYDRLLLGTCRTLLQRELTGDERREMRSTFKKTVLAL
jgi:hypothetical protein